MVQADVLQSVLQEANAATVQSVCDFLREDPGDTDEYGQRPAYSVDLV